MKSKQQSKKRRKYDSEFKKEVLMMIHNGRSVREVSESLGIGENVIYRWRAKSGNLESAMEETGSAASVEIAFSPICLL